MPFRTHGRTYGTDIIGPAVFNLGPKNWKFSKSGTLCTTPCGGRGVFKKKLRHFEVFETLRKNRSEDFIFILPKCAKKLYLLHRTIFSPVKIQFWPFLTNFGQNYWRHFGVFETLRKKISGDFFLILPKWAKKCIYYIEPFFSPVKHQFCPFFAVFHFFFIDSISRKLLI